MLNLDDITNESHKELNKKWPFIPDHPYRILIIGSSGSGKTKVLVNLISQKCDIGKIYFYPKYLGEPKYEFLFKNGEYVGIKFLNHSNAFI